MSLRNNVKDSPFQSTPVCLTARMAESLMGPASLLLGDLRHIFNSPSVSVLICKMGIVLPLTRLL